MRLARERRPDVITLDVVMPSPDGWTVLAELKADPALADTPVILISITGDRSRGYALGASECLTSNVPGLAAPPLPWHHAPARCRRHRGALSGSR